MFYRLSENVSSLISFLIILLYVRGKAGQCSGQWTLPRLDSGLVPDLDERIHSAITDKNTFFLPSLFPSGAQGVTMSVQCPSVTFLWLSIFYQLSFHTQFVIRLVFCWHFQLKLTIFNWPFQAPPCWSPHPCRGRRGRRPPSSTPSPWRWCGGQGWPCLPSCVHVTITQWSAPRHASRSALSRVTRAEMWEKFNFKIVPKGVFWWCVLWAVQTDTIFRMR